VTNLPDQIDRAISTRQLFRRGQKILVAVSGGVDSMVLLAVLHALSRKHSWRLAVAHFNHGLRGRSSDADERLVIRVAKKLRLPVVTERADVKKFAGTGRLSVEMAARKLRHDFLARTAARLKAGSVALAHHADDQVELFFLRLLRGSGGEGLAGMKWRRPSPVDSTIALVRPLLGAGKSALLEFAAANRIPFREDTSNASLDFQRNRIRHELLPLLRRRYQPGLDQVVLRVADVVGSEAELVTRLAEAWLKRPARFAGLPIPVQRRVVQLQLLQCQVAPDFELVEKLRLQPGRAVSVLRDILVCRDSAGRVTLRRLANSEERTNRLTVKLGAAGKVVFYETCLEWSVRPQKSSRLPAPRPGREVFDADKVGNRIVLRHWQPGDRFQPIGMSGPVKLQDLFTNQKVPREKRRELLVAATERGELFWVETQRIAERFKLTSSTIRRLEWGWKRR